MDRDLYYKYEMYDENQAKSYDSEVGYDDAFGKFKLGIITDLIFSKAPFEESVVLEVAGGTGELAALLANRYKNLVISDFSMDMIKVAKSKFQNKENITFIVADGLNLPFKDNSFDIVVERGISLLAHDEYLANGIAERFLIELKRVSRNNVIIMHCSNSPFSFLNHLTGKFHNFDEKELMDLLREVNLKNIGASYFIYTVKFLFHIFGSENVKRIENTLPKIPFIRAFGGNIMAFGKKEDNGGHNR